MLKSINTCFQQILKECTDSYSSFPQTHYFSSNPPPPLPSASQSLITSLLLQILRPWGKAHPAGGGGGELPGQPASPPPPLPFQPLTQSSLSWSNNTMAIYQRGHRVMGINRATQQSFRCSGPDHILWRDPRPACSVLVFLLAPLALTSPPVARFPFRKGISEASGKTAFIRVYWCCYRYTARQRWKTKLQKRQLKKKSNILNMSSAKGMLLLKHISRVKRIITHNNECDWDIILAGLHCKYFYCFSWFE